MSNGAPPSAAGGYPVVGHTLSFLQNPLGALEQWGEIDDAVQLQIAGRPVCLVTAPDLVGQVLASDASNYQKAEIMRERLGTLQGGSVVLLEGEDWRDRRRTLQPAVTRERVTAAGSLTTEYATADILARMEMKSMSTYLPERVPTPTNRRYRQAVERLHDRIEAIIERRRDDPSGDDLLSTMLSVGLPADCIRDELIAFLFVGYDSTATALSCTLGLLAEHPGVQAGIREELVSSSRAIHSSPLSARESEILTGDVFLESPEPSASVLILTETDGRDINPVWPSVISSTDLFPLDHNWI